MRGDGQPQRRPFVEESIGSACVAQVVLCITWLEALPSAEINGTGCATRADLGSSGGSIL